MPIPSTFPSAGHHQDGTAAPAADHAAEVTGAPQTAVQIIDPSVLQDMERDFLGTTVVERFARDFSATLDGKIDRLDLCIRDGGGMAAEDAVRSVTTSAVMLGALRLAQAALATQRHLATDDLEAAQRSMALLRACAADTVWELQRTYLADR